MRPLPSEPAPAPLASDAAPRNTLRAGLEFLRSRARGAQLPESKTGPDTDKSDSQA